MFGLVAAVQALSLIVEWSTEKMKWVTFLPNLRGENSSPTLVTQFSLCFSSGWCWVSVGRCVKEVKAILLERGCKYQFDSSSSFSQPKPSRHSTVHLMIHSGCRMWTACPSLSVWKYGGGRTGPLVGTSGKASLHFLIIIILLWGMKHVHTQLHYNLPVGDLGCFIMCFCLPWFRTNHARTNPQNLPLV